MSNRSASRRNSAQSEAFTCIHCRSYAPQTSYGTKHRNHCQRCLWSRHVDEEVGDRQSACRAPMEPISIAVRGDGRAGGEWCIVHRCTGCGVLRVNRIAGDDSERALLGLALRPLAATPFPLGPSAETG